MSQAEISEFDQLIEASDSVHIVEGEIQPLEMNQSVQATDFLNDVVIQLKLTQRCELPHILHSKDI